MQPVTHTVFYGMQAAENENCSKQEVIDEKKSLEYIPYICTHDCGMSDSAVCCSTGGSKKAGKGRNQKNCQYSSRKAGSHMEKDTEGSKIPDSGSTG